MGNGSGYTSLTMGQEIVYCHRCQHRILGSEFERGNAYRVGQQSTCGKCAMQLLPTLPLEQQEQIVAQRRRAADAKDRKAGKLVSGSSTQTPASRSPGARPRVPVAILVGLGLSLVLFVGMLAMSSTPPPPPEVKAPEGPPAREIAARAVFQLAASYAKQHPAELDEQTKLFEKIVADYDKTAACLDARRELEKIARKRRESSAADLAALLARAKHLSAEQELGKAVEALEAARKSHPQNEWSQPIDAKLREIDAAMAAEFPDLRDQAVAARKNNALAELQVLRTKLDKWNSPRYSEELDKALRTVVPPIAPKTNGSLILRVAEATLVGKKLKRVGEGDWCLTQEWRDLTDYVEWDVSTPRAGSYTLKLSYTCPKEYQGTPYGGEFSVTVGTETKTYPIEEHTKNWGDYQPFAFGKVELPAGSFKVTVRGVKIVNNLWSLRNVQFQPIK